jgi:hypothetical protein
VELPGPDGCTPLHYAVVSSDISAISLLQELMERQGKLLDLNMADKHGNTPLDCAMDILVKISDQMNTYQPGSIDCGNLQKRMPRAVAVWELLRNGRALYQWELTGVTVAYDTTFNFV